MGKVNQASADTCHSGPLSAQPLGLYQPSSRTPCQPWVHHNSHTAGPRNQPILMTLYGRLGAYSSDTQISQTDRILTPRCRVGSVSY